MPELNAAPNDASISGAERLLTLDFQNILLTDLLQWLSSNTDAELIPFSNSGFSATNVYDAIVEAATGAGGSTSVTIVTEGSTSTMDPATHAGLNKYIRCAGDVTFDSTESYAAGEVYNIRATAALALLESGVTLTPPSGGTLDLDVDMAVTVVMTSATAGDVIGQTVPGS